MLKGIVKKIFISTTFLLFIFFVFQMIIQNTYLDKLYENSKTNNIKKNLDAFIEDYTETEQSDDNINDLTSNYSKKSNAPILIINENYEILNSNFFNEFNLLTINLGKGNNVHIIVDFLKNINNFSFKNLNKGERVLIQGVQLGNSNFIEPLTINFNHIAYSNKESIAKLRKKSNYSVTSNDYNGYINQMKIISRDYKEFNYTSHVLYNEILNILYLKENIETYVMNNNEKIINEDWSNNYYIIISDKTIIDEQNVYFFTLHKIEKVSFVFSTLNPYYILMYVICFIILIVISFFYTKLITKPLLYLNSVAKKIANLDFSIKSNISTNDELGELSNSLNSVSENLEKAINKLKYTNTQLANEATIRTENEKRIRYLLTNLSHEFKTPLSIISGFIDILKDKVNEKEPDYYYDVILDEIENLDHLIGETIELSKLESGYYNIDFKVFNINDIIKKVCTVFEKKFNEKNLTLIKNTNDTKVYADINKIEQVLINFISNAVKYTKRGKKIYLRIEEYNDDEIIIFIENENKIKNEDITNIWKRFYRMEKTEKKSYKGSGIGLEIVKNILELHDSTYGVKNLEDRVQFFFTLSKTDGV